MSGAHRLTPHFSVGNAEAFGEGNLASVCTKGKKMISEASLLGGEGVFISVLFKRSPEASADTLGTLPRTVC